MNTILALTVAGSCMTVIYLLVSFLCRLSKRTKRVWLITATLFYLAPLGRLRECYVWIWEKINGRHWYFGTTYYDEIKGFFEVRTEDTVYKSTGYRLDALIYGVWFTVAVLLLLYFCLQYFVRRHNLVKLCREETRQEQLSVLDKLRREQNIRRRVRLYYCEEVKPVSVGVWNPIIVLPERMREPMPIPILRHELAHIRNLDIPVKVLMTLAIGIHWFNPLSYLLKKQYGKLCEFCCDDAAMTGCTEEEKVRYVQMLINESLAPNPRLRWTQHLSRNGKFVKERIENIMNERKNFGKAKRAAGAAALAVSLFVSSLTAFAYEDVNEVETKEVYLERQMIFQDAEKETDIVDAWFTMDESLTGLSSMENIPILYDEQFVDDKGNIFEVHSEITPYLNCNHEFDLGTYVRHTKYTDGGCRMDYIDAKRCGWCGLLVWGDVIQSTTYTVCPH